MTDSLPPRIQQVVDIIAEACARRLRNEMFSRTETATKNTSNGAINTDIAGTTNRGLEKETAAE